MPRRLYKRAMRGVLPEDIVAKTKQRFGLPFRVWICSHDGLRPLSEVALVARAGHWLFKLAFVKEAVHLSP